MDLAEFLLARIDEDRIAAQAALERGSSVYDWAVLRDRKFILADAHHIPRWSPRRVLAECAFKREIVRLWSETEEGTYGDQGLSVAAEAAYALAAVYADHPDYRSEWANSLTT